MVPIRSTPEWARLEDLKQQQAELNLRQIFADDPGRAAKLSFPVGDLMADLSKHLITDEVMTYGRSLINQQVENGIAARMAVLYWLKPQIESPV